MSQNTDQNPQKIKPLNNFTLSIHNEDHTLMNALRYTIQLCSPEVDIVGYTIPHPSEQISNLRIQYTEENDQNISNMAHTVKNGLTSLENIIVKIFDKISVFENQNI
ncbi:putative Rpb3/Rpb11-like subunit of RNA polymerase [Hamiltosporidium tvaerminnensis]|uniref:Putative Rpb3/Rpb11-like subunit of RNA polymerase n=2 Tax=Hamiltosporidium TaxID=1176354 RepID=A0A4Q9L278_9MICR|nr:RNA polymerase subunit AC19 [Hamiltosporidium tvaerminnensis]TBU00168.1 putative Rpb3/Rpb11-like subunit of RNA polymerase [Hamiltosporidium tvaerminnensis]TBU01497.1 putative Rpb3/Rpb11-like subunit of RNA polymerase [Hamiltosporidium magnivora]TBU03182.1 putative Rpb3/Rpb11-like subunit of RNA polymerase [Hamiltosporidium magnivora]TBU18615.1 putative Rpb3/Rpb11-like subunit of RNA polymerase [Hamiltosporidium tvaerminnensis]